jgi:hypothetical protein
MEPLYLCAGYRPIKVEHLQQSILFSSVIADRAYQIALKILCTDGVIDVIHEFMMVLSKFSPFDIVFI